MSERRTSDRAYSFGSIVQGRDASGSVETVPFLVRLWHHAADRHARSHISTQAP